MHPRTICWAVAGAGVFAAARRVVARREAGSWRSPVRPPLTASAA